MAGRGILLTATCLALAAAAGVIARSGDAQEKSQPPLFRAGVTLVPIDVRVVDRQGKAIVGLTQADFTILENGVPQQIRQFVVNNLTAAAVEADAKLPIRSGGALTLAPQSNRVFLLMLGRGKLQEPSKGVDALLNFVRNQLLPQDQVAVFAYDRATDFTTNHEEVAKIIERFKRMHYDIDFEIGLQVTSGLAAVYGSKAIPKAVQRKVDVLFEGSPLVRSHPMTPRVTAQFVDDTRKQTDVLKREQEEAVKAAADAAAGLPHYTAWNTLDVVETQMFTDLPFEQFIEVNAQTLQDMGNCFAGIEYLRHIEGEKHLVFVTEKGMALQRLEDDENLARAANDARVAIDVIQTGGIYQGQTGGLKENTWTQTFAFQALRNMSEWTGGTCSIMDPGQMALDRLNDATRTSYMIGYYPSNSTFDGTYRNVEVKVRHPGASVLYRHGYYARLEILPFDRRAFISENRILAALTFSRPVTDIKLKLDAKMVKAESGEGHDLQIGLKIDPSRLFFRTTADGSQLGLVEIAVFWFDQKGQMLGNTLQKAELKFTEEVFQGVKKSGIPYSLRIPVDSGTRNLRVVVYDYKADLIGSADGKVI
jgi:VWFA-related protein